MDNILKSITNFFISKFDVGWNYFARSYSQEGEDIVLGNIFSDKFAGFYIDIGAHHPFRFSNTYLFYKKGWRGINIDATPKGMDLFKRYRPQDINLEIPISNSSKKLDYYIFDEPALNGFSKKLSDERNKNTSYKIKEIIHLKPQKLSDVLDKYLPKNTKIDFMNIDVESFEYEVLISNNWEKYKPDYFIIEILEKKFENIYKNKIYQYLKKKNYSIIAITGRSVIFKHA